VKAVALVTLLALSAQAADDTPVLDFSGDEAIEVGRGHLYTNQGELFVKGGVYQPPENAKAQAKRIVACETELEAERSGPGVAVVLAVVATVLAAAGGGYLLGRATR
jgi:hypothetical protein